MKEFKSLLSPSDRQELSKKIKFYRGFVSAGDLCFDVGANYGNRTEPLLKIGASVLAVEPQETCYEYLQLRFGNNIKLVTKGLCETVCVRKFHIADSSVISSFSDEWIDSVKKDRFRAHSWDKTIEVEMTTLDNLIEEFGLPTFIKIDVEGYELEVLRGLSHPINMISFEYTVPEQAAKVEECTMTVEKINANFLCNFSVRESMKWALADWLYVSDFLKFIKTDDFVKTRFGDIYLKHDQSSST